MSEMDVGIYSNNLANVFRDALIERLKKEIAFGLSDDGYQDHYIEEVAVALDILATLCKHWKYPPWISEKEVQGWRDAYHGLVQQVYAEWRKEYNVEFPLNSFEVERRKVIEDTFDRMENAVRNARIGLGSVTDGNVGSG
jgi:hypothetical protein